MKPTMSASVEPEAVGEAPHRRASGLPNSSMSTPLGETMIFSGGDAARGSGPAAAPRRSPPPRRRGARHRSRSCGSAGSGPSPRGRCRCRPPHPPRRRGSRRPAAGRAAAPPAERRARSSTGRMGVELVRLPFLDQPVEPVGQRPDLAPFAERRGRRLGFGRAVEGDAVDDLRIRPLASPGAARSGRRRPSPCASCALTMARVRKA